MLRRIFTAKKDGIIGDWRKLHNEEPHNLYYSPNIIRMVESRRVRWAGHVACMGMRTAYGVLVGKARPKQTPWKT
jgi:hypothetical protein